MPISKSALVTATVHQFQKLRLVLCMVFNQEFEFCVQNFFTSLFGNSIFLHSEARLSSIMQNWKKLLSFHYCIPKGVTNFECLLLNLHTLNYHTPECPLEPGGSKDDPECIFGITEAYVTAFVIKTMLIGWS